jgi:hypothetical protein
VASESGPWSGALADDGTRDGFDRDPVGRESHAPVRLAERADKRSFLMKRDRPLLWGIIFEAFHRLQAPAAEDRSGHLVECVPAFKAAMCGNGPCKQIVHVFLL